MAKLGDRVIYTAHKEHHVGDAGSVHHGDHRVFAGTVGAVHNDGTYDIAILVPNRELKWVDRVREGSSDHEFTVAA